MHVEPERAVGFLAPLVEIRLGASGDGETEKDDSIGGHALVIEHGATSVGLCEGFYGNDDVHPLARRRRKRALPHVFGAVARHPILRAHARDVRSTVSAHAITQRIERVEIHRRIWIHERFL